MTALQQFLDKYKTTIAVIAIAVLCVYSQMAQAKTTITLDDNLAISFMRGQIDTRQYQGEIFDVEILNNGELVATADRILLKSEGTFKEPDYVIQQFEVDNIVAFEDGMFINVQSIQARDFHLGWLADDMTSTNINPSDWPRAIYEMKNIEVMNEDAGLTLTVPHFEITPLQFDQLSNGKVFFTSLGFEMPSMQIAPLGNGATAAEFKKWLEAAGLPNLEFSLLAQQQNALQSADIVTNSMIQTQIVGFLDLAMRFEFYSPEEAFLRLSDTSRWGDEADAFQSYLLAESKLGGFTINIRDLGLLAFLEESGEYPPYPILADQLKDIMTSYMPETGAPLADAIGHFLVEGGALALSARPDKPFDIENFAIALFMADLVVREINLTAIHTP